MMMTMMTMMMIDDGSDDVDGDCYDGSCDHVVGDDGGNGDLAMIVIIHVMVTTMMITIMIMKVMIVVKVTIMFLMMYYTMKEN